MSIQNKAQFDTSRNPNTATAIEIIAGLFGFMGIGYIYAGFTFQGVVRLIGWWIAIFIGFVLFLLVIPLGFTLTTNASSMTAALVLTGGLCGLFVFIFLAPVISGIMLKRKMTAIFLLLDNSLEINNRNDRRVTQADQFYSRLGHDLDRVKEQVLQIKLDLVEDVILSELEPRRLQMLYKGHNPFEEVLSSVNDPIKLEGSIPPYRINDGRHRIFIARMKGYSTIPAILENRDIDSAKSNEEVVSMMPQYNSFSALLTQKKDIEVADTSKPPIVHSTNTVLQSLTEHNNKSRVEEGLYHRDTHKQYRIWIIGGTLIALINTILILNDPRRNLDSFSMLFGLLLIGFISGWLSQKPLRKQRARFGALQSFLASTIIIIGITLVLLTDFFTGGRTAQLASQSGTSESTFTIAVLLFSVVSAVFLAIIGVGLGALGGLLSPRLSNLSNGGTASPYELEVTQENKALANAYTPQLNTKHETHESQERPVTASSTRSPLSAQERKAILDVEVSKQAQLGWKLSTRTDMSAQLTRNKGPNIIVALLLLIIMILPGVLYLIFAKGEVSLYLEVDEFGNIQRTERG